MIVLWRVQDGSRRVGFAVGRQVRGAVRRNRVRRRLREAYRMARELAPTSVDLVVIGRASAQMVGAPVLVEEMREAFRAMTGMRGGR